MKRILSIAVALAATFADAATAFSGKTVVRPTWAYTKTRGQSSNTETFGELLEWTHTNGTNANQMTSVVTDSATLTNSQSRAVNLLSIADGFGDTVVFSKVKLLAVSANATNVDAIAVGNGGPDSFCAFLGSSNDVVRVMPGGVFVVIAPDAAGYAVGSTGNLQVTNTGTNNASYVLYVGGVQ